MVIDVYDILQSKEDKATVPIYYEARLAKSDLKPEERPKIDPNFDEVKRRKTRSALVGNPEQCQDAPGICRAMRICVAGMCDGGNV